jgi:hypothetical protein
MNEPWEIVTQTCGWEGRPDFYYSLYNYSRYLIPPGSTILEIGTGRGDSAISLALGLRDAEIAARYQGPPGNVYTVEPGFISGHWWFPDYHRPEGYTWTYDLAAFLERCRYCGVQDYITAIAKTSDEVFREWDGKPLAALHIDGAHVEKNLREDLRFTEFLQPGSILILDDWFDMTKTTTKDFLKGKPFRCIHESTLPDRGFYIVTLFERIA